MKYIRRINDEFGIHSRLWTIRKNEFMEFLNGLNDVGCEVIVSYLYYSPEKREVSPVEWSNADDVNMNMQDTFYPSIVIRIAFFDLSDVDKTLDFYREIGESRDRFLEKFGDNFSVVYRRLKAKTEYENGKDCVGYNFFIIDK